MPTTGDVFRITQCGTIFDQQWCNVFYYIVAAWTGNVSLEDVLDEFADTIITPVIEIQSPSVLYETMSIADTNQPEVYFEKPLTQVGQDALAPSLPSYAAFGFKLIRTDRSTRNGAKRFPGVPESAVVGNLITGPTSTTFTDIETALAASLVVTGSGGGSATLNPCIVRFSPLDPYQVSELNLVSEAQLQLYVTTQNSRKPGRGN